MANNMGKTENQYDFLLITPDGIQQNVISISCPSEEDEDTTEVIAWLRYDTTDYYGYGKDALWIDAIADLQNKLPDGVILKCCVACQHGNMCPVGSNENEVFCLKDILPKEKSDLFYYTENRVEREKRSRKYFDSCNHFDLQSKKHYTYNDYLVYLKLITRHTFSYSFDGLYTV